MKQKLKELESKNDDEEPEFNFDTMARSRGEAMSIKREQVKEEGS